MKGLETLQVRCSGTVQPEGVLASLRRTATHRAYVHASSLSKQSRHMLLHGRAPMLQRLLQAALHDGFTCVRYSIIQVRWVMPGLC